MTMIETVGWVLLHFIWQGVAIAVALAVLLALTSPAQAMLRYGLSFGALTLMLATTVTTAAHVLAGNAARVQRVDVAIEAALSPSPTATVTGAPEKQNRESTSTGAIEAVTARRAPATYISALAQPIVAAAMPWLVLGWAIGVMLLSIRLVGGWWRTRALRIDGVSAVPAWCQAQLTTLSARLRVTRPVAIVASVRVSVPIVLGHLKPIVVLPAAVLAGLSPAQLEAILAHELAHVRRHDYLVNLAQTVIETLLFYHPAVWWVSRQVRVAREHCCDDLAVAVCGSRERYVHALLGLEELRQPAALLALGATGSPLLARARRLLAQTECQSSSPRLAASIIALTVVASAAAGASFASDDGGAVVTAIVEDAAQPSRGDERPATPTDGNVQEAPTAPVATAPDQSGPLASRWAWAERTARDAQHARYWIGYAIAPVKTLPPLIYLDRSSTVRGERIALSGQIFITGSSGLRFPGRRLAVPPSDTPALKLLFEFGANRGTAVLRAVHISTLPLPADTKDLPILWLGSADPTQSLEHVVAFYGRVSSIDLKNDLVAAAGVHDASPAVVKWLEQRIASRDPDNLRGDAAEWIAWHPIAASVRVLDHTARTDRASRVRQEAAEALGDLPLPEAAPALIALAQSLTDLDARREAVEALGARPELAARDALGSIARQDPSPDIQREAVETLGDLRDQLGVPLLMELARAHPSIDVRREAVETLGDALPNDTVVPFLEQLAMNDPHPQVQEQAVDALAELEHENGLATLIKIAQTHPLTSVRREAVEALAHRASEQGEGSAQRIVDLLSTLAKTDREAEVQIEAVETLGEIPGTAAVERLRDLARTHPDDGIRAKAIESLGDSRPTAETAQILRSVAFADSSTRVQHEAIETLGELPDGAGISALLDIAREHPTASARKQALEALLESDHPRAREVFRRALQKSDR